MQLHLLCDKLKPTATVGPTLWQTGSKMLADLKNKILSSILSIDSILLVNKVFCVGGSKGKSVLYIPLANVPALSCRLLCTCDYTVMCVAIPYLATKVKVRDLIATWQ